MSKAKVTCAIAELNIFLVAGDGAILQDVTAEARAYVEANYPGENWEYIGAEAFSGNRVRVLFQRIDLKITDAEMIVGDPVSAPWVGAPKPKFVAEA
jgi:hypothetical protein